MEELLAQHAGIWSQMVLGFDNPPFIEEWYDLAVKHDRLCVVAPREFAKTQVFSVNVTAQEAVYRAGSWQYIFSATLDQAKQTLERVVSMVQQARPDLVHRMPKRETAEVIFTNWSRVTAAGAGRAVRGAHPDRIVGDDVLTDETAGTNHQRRKMDTWWFGIVAPMAHAGVERPLGWGRLDGDVTIWSYPSTRIVLVGTPFHQLDLLMSMRDNPIYQFRRYAAVFDVSELVPGSWAVEAS